MSELRDPRVSISTAYLSALESWDIPRLMELSSDHPEWHFPGRSDLAGDHEGREAVEEFLTPLSVRIGPIDLRPQDILTSEDHVVVLCDAKAKRGVATYELAGGFLFDIREQLVMKVFSFALDLYSLDQLLSEPPEPD